MNPALYAGTEVTNMRDRLLRVGTTKVEKRRRGMKKEWLWFAGPEQFFTGTPPMPLGLTDELLGGHLKEKIGRTKEDDGVQW